MSLKTTEGADPNYLATIVKVPTIKHHPNADKLCICEVFGNTVIIAKDSYQENELVVYFPFESAISTKFLSWANLLDKPELNADQTTNSYFSTSGRVKAIALRGIPSQGFLFKVSKLAEYYSLPESAFKLGEIFDTVKEDVLVKKYIKGDAKKPGEPSSKKTRIPKWMDATISVFPRPIRRNVYLFINAWYNRNSEGIKSQIVNGQFQFHYKTEQLGRNIYALNASDTITVSNKMHGTSAIYANILCKKPFSPIRSILKAIGKTVEETEYKFIYSSRSILKNKRDGNFTDDVWGKIAKEFHHVIPENFTIYGEIVGYSSSNGMVQKNYDYGVPKGECEFRVYRITENTPDGVRELEWYEIEEFCYANGLRTVPVYYNGEAKDLFPEIPVDDNWRENFLTKLKEVYLDNICELCTTGVVNEGIVLRNESKEKKTALKFKSSRFLIQESSARDAGEDDMEEDA